MVFRGFESVQWNRRRRRTLVVAIYLWAAIYLALGAFISVLGEWFAVLLLVTLVPACLFVLLTSMALRASVQNLTERKAEELDERQRTVLYRAHYHSYRVLAAITAVTLIYLVVAIQFLPGELWLPENDNFLWFCAWVYFLFASLPTSVAAWTEPDPEPEGDS